MTILAHLGHGLDGFWAGALHPIGGLDHLLAMVAVGVLAAVLADRHTVWVAPAAFVGGMVVGGALGIAGVGAGFVETAIAVSVVVLGVLIALSHVGSLRIGAWIPAAAFAFGGVHGLAHGGEVPASGSPAAYVIGFVVTTALLHAGGVLVGTATRRAAVARTALGGVVSTAGLALLVGLPA